MQNAKCKNNDQLKKQKCKNKFNGQRNKNLESKTPGCGGDSPGVVIL